MLLRNTTIALSLCATLACANNGFVVTAQSAKGSSMADAFIAQVDDASSNYYNPAGLANTEGTQIMGGMNNAYQTGWKIGEEEARTQVLVAPHMYVSHKMANSNWAFGVGVNASYPLMVQRSPISQYADTYLENNLLPLTINPNVAYKFEDIGLSIGAGVSYTYAFISKDTLSGGVSTRAELEGGAFGYNLGLTWEATEDLTVAATYRGKYDIDLKGDVDINAGGMPMSMSVSTSAILPAMTTVGIAYDINKDWTVELDIARTYFGEYKNDRGENWEDTWSYRIGTQYALNESLDLRFGYAFEETPVPDDVVGPDLPDSNNHTFTTGLGYHSDNFSVDWSIGNLHREERRVNNAYINNKDVELDVYFSQISFGYKF